MNKKSNIASNLEILKFDNWNIIWILSFGF